MSTKPFQKQIKECVLCQEHVELDQCSKHLLLTHKKDMNNLEKTLFKDVDEDLELLGERRSPIACGTLPEKTKGSISIEGAKELCCKHCSENVPNGRTDAIDHLSKLLFDCLDQYVWNSMF